MCHLTQCCRLSCVCLCVHRAVATVMIVDYSLPPKFPCAHFLAPYLCQLLFCLPQLWTSLCSPGCVTEQTVEYVHFSEFFHNKIWVLNCLVYFLWLYYRLGTWQFIKKKNSWSHNRDTVIWLYPQKFTDWKLKLWSHMLTYLEVGPLWSV